MFVSERTSLPVLKKDGALCGASWKCPGNRQKDEETPRERREKRSREPCTTTGQSVPTLCSLTVGLWVAEAQRLCRMEDWLLSLGFAGKGLTVCFGDPSANSGPEPERTSFAHKWDGVDLPDFEVPRALTGLWEAREVRPWRSLRALWVYLIWSLIS